MRRVAALVGALAAVAPRADACPCRGTTGPSSALTGAGERVGVSTGLFARQATASFDDRGARHAYGGALRDRAVGLSLAAGVRPTTSTELSLSSELARSSFVAGATRKDQVVAGDLSLRLRQDVVALPLQAPGWLSLLVLGAALRAPTSTTASGSAAGASPSSPGLGAWEIAALGDARARLGSRLVEGGLAIELAARAPDRATGVARRLGPRALGRVMLLVSPTLAWTVGAHADAAREGEVRYDGRVATDSDQRLFSAGAWVSRRAESGWQAAIFASGGLPVGGKNAVVSTVAGLSVTVSR